MNMAKLTIGQMARINHVSQQALRHYDREGLLHPAQVDEATGYRYYHINQSARLDMIQYMKSLGMSLRDIREQLTGKDPGRILEILQEKSKQIESQMQELQQQKRAVERTMDSLRRYKTAPPDGTIVLEYIEERTIYCFDAGLNFYHNGIEVYEQMLRRLKDQIRDQKLPEIYFWNAGTILRKEYLNKRIFHSSEVFVLVEKDFVEADLLSALPAATYLCIYCDGFEKEEEYAQRLLDHMEKQGYGLAGDYVCEVIYEPPAQSGLERTMYLRLQVPILFR